MNGNTRRSEPPKLAVHFLGWVLPADRLREVLGDLEEDFRLHDCARSWYWKQTLLFGAHLMVERFREADASYRGRRPSLERSRGTMMDRWWQDARYALRMLTRTPGFAAVTVLTLALGIGANTAIFTVVNSVILTPLPFEDSERLVALCETNEVVEGFCIGSPPNVEDWRERSETFDSVGLGRGWPFTLQGRDGSEGIQGGIATPGLFRAFRIEPFLGRSFVEEDLEPGRNQVILLSYALWQSRFGGDREIVGQELVLDGKSHEVVGVLPPDAELPHLKYVQMWAPLPFSPADEENRNWRGFAIRGRLKKNVELDEARAEMEAITGALAQEYPEANRGWGISVVPLHELVVGSARSSLLVFLGAVGFVLLIVCVNVANLLLARATDRRKELAIRVAVGAGRFRVVRQLLTESLLLAGIGGLAGVMVARWTIDVFLSLAPSSIPRLDEVGMDGRALGFAVIITVLTSVVFGLLPAWRASNVDLNTSLKEGRQRTAGRAGVGFREGLVVFEVAIALVLLIGAGLLTRSFATILGWEPGFDRQNLLTVWVYSSEGKYPEEGQIHRLFERAAEEIATVPSVVSVGATSAGPLFGGRETGRFRIEAGSETGSGDLPVARWFDVDKDYFRALGVPLKAGRQIASADDASAPPVAIINETMARRYWPQGSPLGERVTYVEGGMTFEVIGIVRDIKPFLPGTPVEPEIYWPKAQRPRGATYYLIRTDTDPGSLVTVIRDRLKQVDPDMNVRRFATMDQLIGNGLVRPRFNMLLLGTFAAVALVLAMVGTYGVMSYSVSQRTHEIGLRISLGAKRGDVLRLVLWRGFKFSVIGVAIGAAAARLMTQGLSSMLFGISPDDFSTFATVSTLLIFVALMACYVPARRAARVDPIQALRQE